MVLSAKRIDPEPGAGTEIMRKTAGGTRGYDFENLRFENHWMKQYILISVDRVRYFFQHIYVI